MAPRDLAGHCVALLVLQEDHRVVVADGGDKVALGVVWGGWHHDLDAGDMAEEHLQALGVLGGQAIARATGGPHDDG